MINTQPELNCRGAVIHLFSNEVLNNLHSLLFLLLKIKLRLQEQAQPEMNEDIPLFRKRSFNEGTLYSRITFPFVYYLTRWA